MDRGGIVRIPLISVITPVYNVEPYIHDYLDGVLRQTYDNLEIICVDDGSPDRCGNVLDRCAEKDSRLTVIHQQNQGYTCALNRALECLTGQYVCFIDPDDWAEKHMCEALINMALETGAEIAVSNFYRDFPDRRDMMKNAKPIPAIIKSRDEALRCGFEADIYRGFKMYLWNKLFSARFFLAENRGGLGYRMNESMNTGADSLLVTQCFLNANKIAYTPEPLYHYRIREDSIMRSAGFTRRLGFNAALESIASLLEREQIQEEVVKLVKRFHTYYCSQLAEYAYSIADKPHLEFSKAEMHKFLNEYREISAIHPDRVERINRILELELDVSDPPKDESGLKYA